MTETLYLTVRYKNYFTAIKIFEVVCHYNSNPIKSIEETEYADAVFYYEKKEVNLFYDPAKVNILYALESFSIYRDEEVAFKGKHHFIVVNVLIQLEGVGVYFQVSANYHQENDEIVIKARQEGRRFVHVPITYAEDSYFDKPVMKRSFFLLNLI